MKKSIFYILGLVFVLAACSGISDRYDDDEYSGCMGYDEQTSEYMTPRDDCALIDSYQPRTMAEREEVANHWNTARKETRWQEYKGTMVRVEILLGDTDVREMRLRLMPNASGADVDGDYRMILGKVADYEMKRVCGRNAESIMMVYDRPSFEVMRPSSFYDYRIEAEGSTLREYGFRCVYNND